jgi:hypothetical protein
LKLGASLTGVDQQLHEGVDRHTRDPGSSRKAHPLDKKGDDLNAPVARSLFIPMAI